MSRPDGGKFPPDIPIIVTPGHPAIDLIGLLLVGVKVNHPHRLDIPAGLLIFVSKPDLDQSPDITKVDLKDKCTIVDKGVIAKMF